MIYWLSISSSSPVSLSRIGVGAAAYLVTCAAVGAGVHLVQAHVAFAAYRHTQRSVAEHLQTHHLSVVLAYVFLFYGAVDFRHLLHVEFACQHHNVGKLRIESHSLGVADIYLSGDVHFLTDLAGIEYGSHVGEAMMADALPSAREMIMRIVSMSES